MNTAYFDRETAWKIQGEVGKKLFHHHLCSSKFAGPGYLCDCGAVEREWLKRAGKEGTK